ncbi:MAG: hypothetical protein AAF721_18560 [Myxococcota bacterium]
MSTTLRMFDPRSTHLAALCTAACLLGACGGVEGPSSETPTEAPARNEPAAKGNAAAIVALTRPSQVAPFEEPAPACEAAVADPALLFQSTLLVRPPKGVEFYPDDGNPLFAQAAMSGGFLSACDGIVKRMLVFVYANDADKELADFIEEILVELEQQGYEDGMQRGEYRQTSSGLHAAFDFEAAGGVPATTLHLTAMRRSGTVSTGEVDNIFLSVFETSPEDYDLLEETFVTSGDSFLLVPE